ncbi:polysaccharide deacetylase [Glutamicibacter sp. PS]|uniref:polysaccharide deacetylase n=1 Tax=Glutamicibacter sp. PS TaxID=3075634 RepID=UPI00283AD768|nr:polysaccharide deacetylase [Glutamicibacter sp. PS]MDR4533792.1 polysaccharide deacetylase [Glutamicibacter sp. PS]
MRSSQLVSALLIGALVLSGCSAQPTSDPTESSSPSSSGPTAQEKEAARVSQVKDEINRLADGYDLDAAIKLAESDSNEQITSMVRGLKEEKEDLVTWKSPQKISHLFFHSLVVDPKRAFDGDEDAQGYKDYMVTQKEFEAILAELYKRDYVLVNPHDFAGLNEKGKMAYRKIKLPKGKTPLVISVDDLSYYEYMEDDGFASKLIIDKNGKVRNLYVDGKGEEHVGAYDVTTLIDDFVAEHPDFSYRGARGIVALTGYNGIFGYRTSASQYKDSKTLKKDQQTAQKIAEAMKDTGWVFASHSWGHIATGTVNMDRFNRDRKLWRKEVRPLIGDTDQFIFPFGSELAGVGTYHSARYRALAKDGFDFFYGVDGTTTSWMQQGEKYQRQMRINIDGLQFAKQRKGDRPVLDDFFDVDKVIDPARK